MKTTICVDHLKVTVVERRSLEPAMPVNCTTLLPRFLVELLPRAEVSQHQKDDKSASLWHHVKKHAIATAHECIGSLVESFSNRFLGASLALNPRNESPLVFGLQRSNLLILTARSCSPDLHEDEV